MTETDHAEPSEMVPFPNYRVNFWEKRSPECSWSLDAYVLLDVAEINEVLDWAREHANARPYEVFAEFDDEEIHELATPRTTPLIRLFGEDPNDPNSKYNA
ncbi:hypothetical protein ACTXJG_04720 [Glutamicibacter arilaitensis]|uniref:hypothetical protein n=1 Tax=Glutamicibacter arilaitensis TaxID=256701 RepID=UPI003FD314CB